MSRPGGLVLFHGAGGDRNHRLFCALEAELALPVARCNFPYRDRGPGRRPPDRMPKLIDSVRMHVARCCADWGLTPDRLVLGGRSLGGRVASLAVAAGLPAAGLLLLSYPLHPPGKPENLRVEHFGSLRLPVLFVQGTSDPFGAPAELARHLADVPGPVRQIWLDGTGHDPVARHDPVIIEAVRDWLNRLDDPASDPPG
jgi:uncharacterized protein